MMPTFAENVATVKAAATARGYTLVMSEEPPPDGVMRGTLTVGAAELPVETGTLAR